MNFKYKYPADVSLPLIEMLKIQLKLPQVDSEDDCHYICSK